MKQSEMVEAMAEAIAAYDDRAGEGTMHPSVYRDFASAALTALEARGYEIRKTETSAARAVAWETNGEITAMLSASKDDPNV